MEANRSGKMAFISLIFSLQHLRDGFAFKDKPICSLRVGVFAERRMSCESCDVKVNEKVDVVSEEVCGGNASRCALALLAKAPNMTAEV
jgi:hypothetical protein